MPLKENNTLISLAMVAIIMMGERSLFCYRTFEIIFSLLLCYLITPIATQACIVARVLSVNFISSYVILLLF